MSNVATAEKLGLKEGEGARSNNATVNIKEFRKKTFASLLEMYYQMKLCKLG